MGIRFAAAGALAVVMAVSTAQGAAASPAETAGAPKAPRHAGTSGDFDGDGHRDTVATGVTGSVDGVRGAGFVTVAYGGTNGPNAGRRQVISQNSPGVPDDAEEDDAFGAAVASADFDGDGYADLAVGASGEDVSGTVRSGLITVIYGSPSGLSERAVTLSAGEARSNARLGESLAAADINGNGRPDLVAASVGSSAFWTFTDVGTGGVTGERTPLENETGNLAWATPVTADFTGDGFADLAILRADNIDGVPSGGQVELRLGSSTGLGEPTRHGTGGRIGRDGAAGDINGDGRADLVTSEAWFEVPGAGAVNVLLGTGDGLGRETTIDQDTPGVPGTHEDGDAFGASIALGDVNGDGRADAAIGAPGEDVGDVPDAGAVTLLYGGPDGLTVEGAQMLGQNTAGVPGSSERDDRFGADVALNDVTGEGRADLLAGAPGEDGGEGRVLFFHGTADGASTSNVVTLSTSALGVEGRGARLGTVLLR